MSEPGRESEAMVAALARMVAIATRFVAADRADPVRETLEAEHAHDALELALPQQGRPLDEVLDALERVLLATPATAGSRFWNQLFGGREAAATVADMLASLANNSMYTYKVAGPQVLIENLLAERMMAIAGFAGGEATFAPGGSLSNLVALLVARGEAIPEARSAGVDARRYRIYTSSESHYSIRKAAMVAGIGREHCVAVEVDAAGRLDPSALDARLRADRAAGLLPILVNATAGTTVRGAFDPIDAVADVCAEHGVWLHVDGAFGGTLLLADAGRPLLAGLERADSFTWDAHKLMGVPLLCSIVMVRRAGLLTHHLGECASYLFQGDTDALNPGTRSLQCGRRNDALKLWAAWQTYGDAGWARRVERQLGLAQQLAARIEAHPRLELVEPPPSLNVCFRVPGVDAAAICARLAETRRQLVGYGTVRGEVVIRAAVVDPAHDAADLATLLDDVAAAADAIAAG